jgi:hypothetical protein
MATVHEDCTTEEQRVVVLFCMQKLNAKNIHKEIFPVYDGKCRVKRFTTVLRNSLKDIRKSHTMPDQVQKWLRQQSKVFYAAGFDALVKPWDKWWRIYREIHVFFSRFEYHKFYVLYSFVTYLLTLPRMYVLIQYNILGMHFGRLLFTFCFSWLFRVKRRTLSCTLNPKLF